MRAPTSRDFAVRSQVLLFFRLEFLGILLKITTMGNKKLYMVMVGLHQGRINHSQ